MKAYTILLTMISFTLASCQKEPGVGGDATISGSVITHDYNATFTSLIGVYPSEDVYVYIKYGDHPGFDKRVKTDYNGTFQFEHLYKGSYQVYVYSADSLQQDLNNQIAVVRDVTINERKEVVELEPIIIAE